MPSSVIAMLLYAVVLTLNSNSDETLCAGMVAPSEVSDAGQPVAAQDGARLPMVELLCTPAPYIGGPALAVLPVNAVDTVTALAKNEGANGWTGAAGGTNAVKFQRAISIWGAPGAQIGGEDTGPTTKDAVA